MTETQTQLLLAAQTMVTDLFSNSVPRHFVFHNLEHTRKVAFACELLAAHHQLNDEDQLVLLLAAWFHDTGFSTGEAKDHEKHSVQIATEFLEKHQSSPELIQRVASCIEATRMPQSPVSLVEKILCDADLYHLGTEEFREKSQLLRKEQEDYLGHKVSKKEWRQRNIEFLENHSWFTEYCAERLEPEKQKNLEKLRRKQGDKKSETPESSISPYEFEDDAEKQLQKKKAAADKNEMKRTERGVQTMFRTTSQNHFRLSEMADSKANIMISVTAIIISIGFPLLLSRLIYYPHFMVPTFILLVVCLTAIIFAILATRPSVTGGTFTVEDIRSKRTNLLFFGNFHRMQLDEYQWGMNELLKDREYLYSSMVKDIYFLGVVLARKYRFLRISYTIFMYGLIASVLAFVIASIVGSPD